MKCAENDLHLHDLLDKIAKKERVLNMLPYLERDDEMEEYRKLAREVVDMKIAAKDWWMSLREEL